MTLGGWLHQARAARAEERYAAALDGVVVLAVPEQVDARVICCNVLRDLLDVPPGVAKQSRPPEVGFIHF